MISTLSDNDLITLTGVNKTMFIIDTSTPESRPFMFEWLGFADSIKWVSLDIFHQCVDTLED